MCETFYKSNHLRWLKRLHNIVVNNKILCLKIIVFISSTGDEATWLKKPYICSSWTTLPMGNGDGARWVSDDSFFPVTLPPPTDWRYIIMMTPPTSGRTPPWWNWRTKLLSVFWFGFRCSGSNNAYANIANNRNTHNNVPFPDMF